MPKIKLKYKENKAYFKNLEKVLVSDIEDEIERTTTDIEADAQVSCPVDLGVLRSSINSDVEGLEGTVRTNVKYAPYIEFGTGGLVDVPEGLEDYAMKFKGEGIKQVNMRPQPFLYPAFKKNGLKMLERLEKKINGSKQGS